MTKKIPLFKDNFIELPAVEVFNVGQKIVVDKHNIAWVSPEVVNLIASLVERNVPKIKIQTRMLTRSACTREIVKVVGRRGAISWAHLGTLLDLKHESFMVIVYVKGKPWAVYAFWYSDGWYVLVFSFAHQFAWYAGHQVLSQVA